MRSGRMLLRILGLVLLLSWPTALQAQLNRGELEGTVSDPQGAVVPGVDVTVTNVDTNVAVTTKTNSAGYYKVVDLVPGKYLAHFGITGFSPVDITEIEVSAGKLMRQDAQLKLGATRELVQVTAEVPLLETAASNFSTSLENRTVQEVPLQGRDLQQLVFLMPGVNNVGGPPGTNFGFNSQFGTFPDPTHVLGSDLSVNGGQGGANAWYLDGNLNLSSFAENIAVNPSPDAVSEFQAITNAFAAEYSRTGGAVFNVVLKSGTNALHGNVYEYIRNEATNARNPFTSIDSLGNKIKDRQLRFNNFGGTLGGPVVFPHLYNGKNKTFFFFSWDTQILHLLGNKVFTVPTKRMRVGDFSEDKNTTKNGIFDPYSTKGPITITLPDGTQKTYFERTAFGTPLLPNGCTAYRDRVTGDAVNPTSSTCDFATQLPYIDPAAKFFLDSFPYPNYNSPLSGCPMGADGYLICDNFLGAIGSSQDPHNISIKIDHKWSEKSTYFAEWLFNPGKYRNYRVPWTGPTFPQQYVGWGSTYPVDYANQIIALGNTYVFSPTLINEFRASFSRQFMTTHPSHPFPESLTGQSAVQQTLAPSMIPEDPFFPIPNWRVTPPGGGRRIDFGLVTWVNMVTSAEAYTILDNVTKIIGKHSMKTGFIYRLEHTSYLSGFPTGFRFNGSLIRNPISKARGGGRGLSQFELGATGTAGTASFSGVMWKPYERFRYWGFYWQDDYRIRPNFTLNLGVRYDLYGLYKTRQNPNSNFCLGCPNPDTGLPGKTIYVGDPDWPTRSGDVAPPNYNSIAPRINFSWTPFANRKTIIRGGYDIFYSNAFALINSPGQSAANSPGWNQEYDWNGSFYPDKCAPFTGQCVAFPLSDTTTDKSTLNTPPLPKTFPAAQKDPLLGLGVYQFFTPPSHDPMIQSWGVEVERELPGNMMINVGYVGTHGTHLVGEAFRQFNYNHTADRIKYKTDLYSEIPITDVYSGKTAAKLQEVYGSSTLPRNILLLQYPFYGAFCCLQDNTAFDGTTIYHGLNVRVQKRYSHGVNFIAAYTISKKINNAMTGQLASMLVDPLHWATKPGLIGGRAGDLGGAINGGNFQDPDNKRVDRAIGADDIPQMFNLAVTYELPFGSGRRFANQKGPLNQVIGGWRLTANFNAESGVPLGISGPCDELTCRPNLIGNPKFSGGRSRAQQINQWINPAAFEPPFGSDESFWANYDSGDPRAYLFGTAGPFLPGIRSPGFWNLDSALVKRFNVSENKYFEFRWEMFNALNHQNLGLPDTGFCLPPGPNGADGLVRLDGCTFGKITNIQTDPRSMQFALKFFW